MLLPLLIFKLIYGYVGEDSGENWINSDIFIYNLLGLPLANFLSLFGYYVHASGTQIIFENLDTGLTQSVSVAESCSGITSIVVFFSLAISYLWVLNFKFDSNIALIILLGIMTSYIANLFRMSIIILAGHYRGMDALQFVHSYLGWFIFTIWMLIFWSFMDKLLNRDNYE